mmetsp:Transcript_14736/g.17816  ORF Transcript_14736/g.17816 Transcript_14736/m.17816 type:complete len:129 (+) Transcript_14736:131-517(+)
MIEFTWETLNEHNKLHNNLMVAHDIVYNVEDFAHLHPGGPDAIINRIGKDATYDFDMHGERGKKVWKQYQVGYLNTDRFCNRVQAKLRRLKRRYKGCWSREKQGFEAAQQVEHDQSIEVSMDGLMPAT